MLARDKLKPNCWKLTKFAALGLISLYIFFRWNSHPQEYSTMATSVDQLHANFVTPHSGVRMPKIIYGLLFMNSKD